jgi:holliday junction DNA helicase RuvA
VIAAVQGRILAKTGDRITVATASGVYYDLSVPLGVLERLPTEGNDVLLRTVLVVRDDGWALYGFDEPYERNVFQRLLGTTGVGPRLALALLSALGGARVVRAISENDLAALCTVPGVGKKTAERLVLELRDRISEIAVPGGPPAADAPAEQAVQALMNLGYGATDADRAVRSALSENGSNEAVDLIRRALQLLTKAT